MTHTLFAGCSLTRGNGFELLKTEPSLWVNLLHSNNVYFKNTKLLNVSRGGLSNASIFQEAVHGMLHNDVKYAVVQWTSMPRYNMSLGLELYETSASFMPNAVMLPCNLNDINYSSEYLSSIRDRFTSLANDHFEIWSLVSYVNSLTKLAKLTNTHLFFINGLCPWDDNYFTKLSNVLPDAYTEYTKKLLNVDTRADEEIFKLYDKIHNEYTDLGTIQPTHWLNLYQSMGDLKEDVNSDGLHPGVKSNQAYYQIFNQAINTKLQSTNQDN